jgi:hypothetical protein
MHASDYPYESFNARALSPKQVAIGFVPPDAFRQLCKRRHSVVAGPRGSGKTTLFKMLQVSALRTWSHEAADSIREQIDFTGVFIPTDRTWGEQLSSVGADRLEPMLQDLLGIAAFTTQILRATVSACVERTTSDPGVPAPDFRRISLSPSQELALSRKLAGAWDLSVEAATLLGLKAALAQRLMKIHQLANQCILLTPERRREFLLEADFLHISYLSAVPAFLDIFEEVSGIGDERWALLFDELELAPERIRTSLTQALRSVDQRLIFKLSIAPFSRELEESVKAASDRNDFDLIRLWYPSKEDGYPFSRSLVRQMLSRRGIKDAPEAVFGFTTAENTRVKAGPEYRSASIYRSLAAKDPSFRRYLDRHGVGIENISLPSESEQAASLRKIVSIVTIRDAYLRSGRDANTNGGAELRSRKAGHIYCGIPAMLAVSEGNPRWLIALVDRLLDSRDAGSNRVSRSAQDREINSLISRFSAFLRTIPNESNDKDKKRTNVYGLIDAIGKALTKEVLEKPFNPDPIGTFIVDSHAPDGELRALEQAVYAGAIIFVPESENEIATGSLRGKRFRLSYLLAPKYKLPLVLLRPKSLGALLSPSTSDVDQNELF